MRTEQGVLDLRLRLTARVNDAAEANNAGRGTFLDGEHAVAAAAQTFFHQALRRARKFLVLGHAHEGRSPLLARALPGGDPLVVRIGSSTFALRRAEAACVLVETAA